jgi:hypothetical protein
MARPSNPEIRARLREQAVDYVISHGAADLTLRPLAKALKTKRAGSSITSVRAKD